MKNISIGKLRGLQQCSSKGIFTCLALDHRQNLRKALNPSDPAMVTDEDLTQFKLEVTDALAGGASAVLLDPEFSAAQAVASGVIPSGTGLVVALESTGYDGDPTERESRILPEWSVGKAKAMGASMVKLLVYYHPDSKTAKQIEDFVHQISRDCQLYDLALMLEPLSYSIDPIQKMLSSSEKKYVVVETAQRLTPLGIDLLKVEFPLGADGENDEAAWHDACSEITSSSVVPWILLSAAVEFETYVKQVSIACGAGASGIAVGRAVWKEAVHLNGPARREFLVATARKRLGQLSDACQSKARPFTEYYSSPTISTDWFKQYGQI